MEEEEGDEGHGAQGITHPFDMGASPEGNG